MATFTVLGATKKKDVPDARNGPAQVINLNLRDAQGTETIAEWFTKATTALPNPGSQIDGDIEQSSYGPKFRKASGGFGGGGRGKSPQESAAIQRMHLQKAAPEWIELFLTLGVVAQPKTKEEAVELGKNIMDWLSKDIDNAKAAA